VKFKYALRLYYWTKEVRGQTLKIQVTDNQYFKPMLSDF